MLRIGWLVTPLCLAVVACAGAKGAPPRQSGATAASPGSSWTQPVVTCGPKESYEYVASKATCPDGSNPFKGNAELASRSRKGSRGGGPAGHLLDVYELPCSEGARLVYVDMYGCPEYEQQLAEVRQETPELTALIARFDAGDFRKVLERCEAKAEHPADERAYCLWLVPASLEALGSNSEAVDSATNVCRAMPAASVQSDARVEYLALLLVTLAQSANNGHYKPSVTQRKELLDALSAGCAVSSDAVQRMLKKVSEST